MFRCVQSSFDFVKECMHKHVHRSVSSKWSMLCISFSIPTQREKKFVYSHKMKMSVHHRLWQRYNLQWFIHSSWNGHFHCAVRWKSWLIHSFDRTGSLCRSFWLVFWQLQYALFFRPICNGRTIVCIMTAFFLHFFSLSQFKLFSVSNRLPSSSVSAIFRWAYFFPIHVH